MIWTFMPIAAIKKYCQFGGPEYKIWLYACNFIMAPPASDFVLFKQLQEA
jgi:hypothetical protein